MTLKSSPMVKETGLMSTILKGSWVWVLPLLAGFPVFSQSGQIRFDHLGLDQGLSQSTIFCTLQDSKGFMWFGTNNGLNRYNGYQFSNYRHHPDDPESIAHDRITALTEDKKGRLWIGTQDGLSMLAMPQSQNRSFVNLTKDTLGNQNLPSQYIQALLVDRKGFLWIGTSAGLVRMDVERSQITQYGKNPNLATSLTNENISTLYEDHDERLWIGTNGGGLNRLNPARTAMTAYRWWNDAWSHRYNDQVFRTIQELKGAALPFVSFLKTGEDAEMAQPFELTESREVLIVALGEGLNEMEDYGVLTHQGTPFWSMDFSETRHAGGHIQNRIQVSKKTLPAGSYTLKFVSDENHHYGNWSETPPDYPNWWGIQLFYLNDDQNEFMAENLAEHVLPPGISGNYISAILEDDQNNIWVGTKGSGLNQIHGASGDIHWFKETAPALTRRYSKATVQSVEDLCRTQPIVAIKQPQDHQITIVDFTLEQDQYLLVDYRGLGIEAIEETAAITKDGNAMWKPNIERTVHGGGDIRNRVHWETIRLSRGAYQLHFRSGLTSGRPHWGFGSGQEPSGFGIALFPLDKTQVQFLDQALSSFEYRPSLAGDYVTALAQDLERRLWVGTTSGLSRFQLPTNKLDNFHHDPFLSHSLSTDRIRSLARDRSGTLWIGTTLGGINKFNPSKNRFAKYARNPFQDGGLSDNLVYSFFQHGQRHLFIGTAKGLSILDLSTGTFNSPDGDKGLTEPLARSQIMAMLKDSLGSFWVATETDGLFKVETVDSGLGEPRISWGSVVQFQASLDDPEGLGSNKVWCLLEDQKTDIWVGTTNGLHQFQRDQKTFLRFDHQARDPSSLSDSNIRTLFQNKPDTMWVGTDGGGLNRFDQNTGQFKAFRYDPKDPQSLSHDTVVSILAGDNHQLWIATHGGGLNRFDPASETFTRFTENDGLPNNAIYGLLRDERGSLWISSNGGLSQFNPATGKFKNYDVGDGLQSNEFNAGAYLKLQNGAMAFGGINGFNLFTPERVKDNQVPPTVVITAVKKFEQPIDFETPISHIETLELPYNENYISFEFVALDYNDPSKNQYAYRLEGIDSDWVYSGTRRFANYPNLDPGAYVFKVKGANNDGIWNETGTGLSLLITPPFWQTIWFYTLVSLCLLTLAFSAYKYRTGHLRRENKLQEEFSKRLIQSQEHERRRIATELHDSLGQNLLVINNELQHRLVSEPRLKQDMEGLSTMILDSINEVRDIAYDLHPHQLERLGLKKAVESVINKVNHSTDVDFDFYNDDIDGLFPKDVEINFYRIIQEAVNNIIKHSEATRAVIQISKEERSVSISIADDGKGFEAKTMLSEEHPEHGIGIAGMIERIKLINGTYKIKSEPGKGTKLRFRVPILVPTKTA